MKVEEKAARLAALEKRALTLASKIGAPSNSLPRFGESNDNGAPYIDYDGLYRFRVQERGVERDHRLTVDEDELMYWVFEPVTSSMASRYEAAHRVPNQDFRRVYFQHQLELLAKLNENWKQRRELEQKEILSRHPFQDQESVAP